MTRGLPLFAVICVLASAPLYGREVGQVAVALLFGLWLSTLRERPKTLRGSRLEKEPSA